MSTDETTAASAKEAGPDQSRSESPPFSRRLAQIARTVQVRLRFVVVLAVAFLVVGLWGNLRNVWDTWRHRFLGGHSTQQGVSIDTEYFCPMCPGVVSDWPAICPVCSMDLVRRKKGDAVLLPEGVVARMQLSPYRIQLAGISTSLIESRALVREIAVAGRLVERPPAESPPDEKPSRSDGVSATSRLILECPVAAGDLLLLTPGRSAQVTLDDAGGAAPLAGLIEPTDSPPEAAPGRRDAMVRIRLADSPAWARAGMYATAKVAVPLSEIEPFAPLQKNARHDSAAGFTAVPDSAVVDTGSRRVVFVETMPGMFDGVEVTLGPRCGDYYPVIKGLEPGQKVAAVGAFLIDAEARLSPDLAAAYFGAARTADPSAGSGTPITAAAKQSAPKRSKKEAGARLSAADRKLAKQQKICPVTEADLDSMGGPVPVDVAGQRVFICCKGCAKALKADPQKYLAKLKSKP